MFPIGEYLWPKSWVGRGCVIATGVAFVVVSRKIGERKKIKQLRAKWDGVGKDVVMLHQFLRGKYCLNLSPFALKLETFLRVAKIEYVVDKDNPYGPKKGKCPWVTLNGEDVEDSQVIVQYLTEKFKVEVDSHLDTRDIARLEAVRVMADEHVFWCVITWRYWLDNCRTFLTTQNFSRFLNFIFPFFMTRAIREKAVWHGIGCHTPDEIFNISKRACHTLSTILGDDPFFGGDRPCTADCSVFGQLSQFMWNVPGSHYEALVKETYPSLGAYCNRMKDTLYPDWDKLLNPLVE
ncbi:failed axon connections homolog isoform X1 [Macrobrachium rosenbergii]|uniref:failed axon connections homolog isoform X1 n=1 Tax=Macrobrachium rosenbergii TaxID=79674 RepID=UPI0034D4016F